MIPAAVTVVVPLRAGAGPGEHSVAMNTARKALQEQADRYGLVVDWPSLRVVTGPLVDLLDSTERADLSGLQATARLVPA